MQNSLQNETHKAKYLTYESTDTWTLVLWWVFSSAVRMLNVWLLSAFLRCLYALYLQDQTSELQNLFPP